MLHSRNSALLLGLAFAGLLAGSAWAANPFKPKVKAEPFAEQIAELHRAKLLLEKADRDYKGHRAEAVKEIGKAIHTLHPGKAHKHVGKVEGGNEPQSLSDAQLREAVKKLKVVEKQLTHSNAEAAAKANVFVAKAIKELEIALEIK
jgi:hypothetical protein